MVITTINLIPLSIFLGFFTTNPRLEYSRKGDPRRVSTAFSMSIPRSKILFVAWFVNAKIKFEETRIFNGKFRVDGKISNITTTLSC